LIVGIEDIVINFTAFTACNRVTAEMGWKAAARTMLLNEEKVP
jgi:hypothetical protein